MERRRKNRIKRIVVVPILLLLLTAIIITFGSSWLTSSSVRHISCLNDGWSVSRGGKTIDNVDLLEYQIGASKKGETITISRQIFASSGESSFMFKSFLTAVEFYVDGERIYTSGLNYLEANDFIPKKYNIVTLGTPGVHNISITFTVGDDNFAKVFPPIYYGQKHLLLTYFFNYHRTSFFIGAFLLIYSCLLISLWVYLALIEKASSQLIIASIFSMMLGFYVFAYNDITCVIGNHDKLFSLLEYMTFYFMPLAFTVLLYSLHADVARNRQTFFIIVNIVYPILFLNLHILGFVHIQRFLGLVGIIATVEMVSLLPALIQGLVNSQKARDAADYDYGTDPERYLLLGCIILIVFSIFELLDLYVFRTNEVITEPDIWSSFNFMELGMLFFMMCHFIYYFMNSIDHMSADRIKSQLEGLAYKDTLTGLMNRARCAQYYASLSGNFAFVSLDMDRLKYVNDNLGHLEGDKMIKSFAELLKKAFNGANLIGRTGGDEFIVVFEEPSADICDKCIRKLESLMAEFNKGDNNFTLSASAGYAYSYEIKTGNYQDVFYLADQRMYKMKEEHHG